MGLLDLFKKKGAPKTLLDKVQSLADPIIVTAYRRLGQANKIAPTTKTTDQQIIEIYQKVGSAFREAANDRNEHIPAGYINTIVFKFIQAYELMGETMFYEHLKYEIIKYVQEGLRADYKNDLKLF